MGLTRQPWQRIFLHKAGYHFAVSRLTRIMKQDNLDAAMKGLQIKEDSLSPLQVGASLDMAAAAGVQEDLDTAEGAIAVHGSAILKCASSSTSALHRDKMHLQEGPGFLAVQTGSTIVDDFSPSSCSYHQGEGRPQLETPGGQSHGSPVSTAGPPGNNLHQARGPSADEAVAGLEPALELLRQAILWPLLHAAEAERLGLKWPRGVLLHGPPGCGKTSLVHAVAAEAGAVVQSVSASTIFGPYQGMVGAVAVD